jgi:hypothetical protein
MTKLTGKEQVHWLDEAIESSWREHDPSKIADAITRDATLISAIRRGLEDARQLPHEHMGSSQTQCIRNAVLNAMSLENPESSGAA